MIYTNGCSYTLPNGGPSWSEHLAKMFNKPLYAAGQAGKSNEKILRETVTDLLKFKNISKTIISLTFENRFDVVVQQKSVSVNPGYNLDLLPDECKQLVKYKNLTQNSLLSLQNTFSYLVALKSLAESQGSDFFVFWGADEVDVVNQDHIVSELKLYTDFLTACSFDLFGFSFCRFSHLNGYVTDETPSAGIYAHPPAESHLKFAKLLYNQLK